MCHSLILQNLHKDPAGVSKIINIKSGVNRQRIYYNFIKPHQALNGQTPAEKTGIQQKNKWKDLLKSSI